MEYEIGINFFFIFKVLIFLVNALWFLFNFSSFFKIFRIFVEGSELVVLIRDKGRDDIGRDGCKNVNI